MYGFDNLRRKAVATLSIAGVDFSSMAFGSLRKIAIQLASFRRNLKIMPVTLRMLFPASFLCVCLVVCSCNVSSQQIITQEPAVVFDLSLTHGSGS